MTEETTQPVADTTNATPEAVTADTSARTDDLDALLGQFEAGTQPQPEPKPAAAPTDDVAKRVEQLERTLAETKFKSDFEPVLKRIRGEIPAEVFSDEEITDWLDGKAKRNPALQTAYLNRNKNPAAWAKVEKTFNAELAKKFSRLPDPDATAERDAVAAAVRSASTKAPPEKPLSLSGLSNAEYNQKVKEQFGFNPGV